MRIYYFLLKSGELTFDNNRELYNQAIYLIPDEDNDVIGIKDMDLQKIISYDARKVDFYLSQYIIVIIITVFFSGRGSFVKSRDFIRIAELEEIITSRISFAKSKKNIELEQEAAMFNI